MNEFEHAFIFVKEELSKANHFNTNLNKKKINYSRFDHTQRVYKWVCRLIDLENVSNERALKMAAILHDVGYGQCIHLPHAQVSAKIARDYLEMNNFELDFINEVVYLVENHSKKELLKNNEVNDLILLQEADLLDDTGALGIILDIMVEHTKNEECDFMDCYNHIIEYSQRIMKNNPMVSKTAKRFWKQKQMMVNNFIESLEQDLGIEH